MSYMLQKSSMLRVLEVFFKNPNKEFYLIDISTILNIAHTSIKIHLEELHKEGLIKKSMEQRGKRKFPKYKAIINKEFKKYKKIHNITEILESEILNYINNKLSPKCIILFGSYADGDDDENSDIDLFIECPQETIEIKIFEKRLQRKIQLHFKEQFTQYPKELKNNIINGVILSGYLEGYK